MNKNGKTIIALIGIAVLVFGVVFGVITLTNNAGRLPADVSEEKAQETLAKLVKNIRVNTRTPIKGTVKDLGATVQKDTLPDISKYPLVADVDKSVAETIEIFSSPEKAGTGTDAWFTEVVEAFNRTRPTVNGKNVGVKLRNVSSGLAVDYIATGKAVPDLFSPSNELWGEMLTARGVKNVSLLEKRLAGNVPGVLFSKDKHKDLVEKYGSVNLRNLSQAVRDGEVLMGYTNPFASSTGLNYLLSTLMTFDKENPLSEKAVQAFNDFSANVPFVAYNTMQMRESALSGSLDGFVLEYQSVMNMPEIKANYVFTPFGVRHDNPLYSIGKLSTTKQAILNQFLKFLKTDEWKAKASDYGFNQLDDYQYELTPPTGVVISQAQKLWKENKSSGQPITAVFVADTSGSMDQGQRLTNLKKSLINGANYIGRENSIGLVSFGSEVNIALPIGKFTLGQQALLVGTVESLRAEGGTAMYDAIVVALGMLLDAKEKDPDTKLLLFVLTDGETNEGLNFDETRGVIKGLKVPVYSIGYNANLDALQPLSRLNEAAYLNADSDDIVYQLAALFNAQM
ncbi:MAG: VWA domain-containing protein [Oscillospiraceae bacterium]|jgi:Ca-activated chloride channel family protein|nr:VWA domain-containing protein [Oscillospiraceae bacterium]